MIKKLVLFFLLTTTLLSSCSTTDEGSYLELAQSTNSLEEKISHYTSGLKRYPENINYIYNSAYTLTLNEQYTEAEEILLNGINLYPKAIYLYTLLAHCYKAEYKLVSYEAVMQSLITIDPGFLDAKLELLSFYMRYGKYKAALPLAESIYELYPTNQQVLNSLAILKGGVFENFVAETTEKKEEAKVLKPYLPPTTISIQEVNSYLKSDSFLSQFLPSDHTVR